MTKKEKPQFFGLYHGQRVMKIDDSPSVYTVNMIKHPMGNNTHLWLKPLLSITDEDAIEVAKIVGIYNYPIGITGTIQAGRAICHWFNNGTCYGEEGIENFIPASSWLSIIDFLRSKCYALPWRSYSVDDLIKEGLIKLQE